VGASQKTTVGNVDLARRVYCHRVSVDIDLKKRRLRGTNLRDRTVRVEIDAPGDDVARGNELRMGSDGVKSFVDN